MYCRNCGSPLPDGTRFCPSCGTAVDASQDMTVAMPGARHARGTAGAATAAGASPDAVPTGDATVPNAPVTPTDRTVTMPLPRAQHAAGGATSPAAVPSPAPYGADAHPSRGDGGASGSSGGMLVALGCIAALAVAATAIYFLLVLPAQQARIPSGEDDALTETILDEDGADEGRDDLSETDEADKGDDPDAADETVTDDASDDLATSTSEVTYGAYGNARYGYSVSVPTSFSAYGESDNGDGATFEDPTTGATLLVWGMNNVLGESAEEVADGYAEGHDLIDRAVTGNAFDLWYRNAGRIVRVRGIVGAGSSCAVQFEYPEDQARQLATISDYVANSLIPGDLSVAH